VLFLGFVTQGLLGIGVGDSPSPRQATSCSPCYSRPYNRRYGAPDTGTISPRAVFWQIIFITEFMHVIGGLHGPVFDKVAEASGIEVEQTPPRGRTRSWSASSGASAAGAWTTC
jgi:hypothetical protein